MLSISFAMVSELLERELPVTELLSKSSKTSGNSFILPASADNILLCAVPIILRILGSLQSDTRQVSSSFLFLILRLSSLIPEGSMDVSEEMIVRKSPTVVIPGLKLSCNWILPHLQLRTLSLVSPVEVDDVVKLAIESNRIVVFSVFFYLIFTLFVSIAFCLTLNFLTSYR